MPRVHDNVSGRTPFIRADADGRGFIRALNVSTAAIVKYAPVILFMNKDGYTFQPSSYAATAQVVTQWIGICNEAFTAAQGIAQASISEIQVVGPAKCFCTVACTTNGLGAIERTTGAYVDSAAATYVGGWGQWAMMRTITTAVSTVSIDIFLPGRPTLRNGTTWAIS